MSGGGQKQKGGHSGWDAARRFLYRSWGYLPKEVYGMYYVDQAKIPNSGRYYILCSKYGGRSGFESATEIYQREPEKLWPLKLLFHDKIGFQRRKKKKKQLEQELEQQTSPTEEVSSDAKTETTEAVSSPLDAQTPAPADAEPLQPEQTEAPEDKDLQVSQADSGIVLDSMSNSAVIDQTSDLTPSDSHPTSPTAEPSEPELSTKASSISESTDETIREKEDEPAQPVDGAEPKAEEEVTKDATPVQEDAVPEPPQQEATEVPPETPVESSQPHISEATEPEKVDDLATEKPAEDKTTDAPEAEVEPMAIPISKFSTSNSTSLIVAAGEAPQLPAVPPPISKEVATDGAAQVPAPSPQDFLAASRAAAEPCVETPAVELTKSPLDTAVEEPVEAAAEAKDQSDAETIPAQPDRERRRGFVEPIRTDMPPPPVPETTAGVPANAAFKTPVTPTFPTDDSPVVAPSLATTPHSIRTVSNPVRGNPLQPTDGNQTSARSTSSGAAFLQKITQQQQGANLSAKPKVGSSISQRIKALEKLSASNAEAPRPVSRERPQSTFFSVKKSDPAKGGSVLDRASSLRQPPSEGSRESSPETSRPPRDRSGSISNRLSVFQSSPEGGRGKHESISVTAKIIRDPSEQQAHEAQSDFSGFNPLDLKQSPLFVNHQKAVPEPTTPALDSSVESLKDDKGRRSSLSLVRGLMKDKRSPSTEASPPSAAQSPPQNNSFSPRMSFSSRRSISKEDESIRSPSGMTEASASGDDAKSTNGDGRMSRAGRFMRRLSTLSGSKSKTSISNGSPAKTPPAAREPTPSSSSPAQGASRPSTTGTSPWIVSYMGDVNVQFPDNLLWKRRNMCLDSQGFLVLSALPAQSSRAAQGTKRYHLSEFRGPYCPDVEVQELPNSVVLDFIEGTSLQLACEDRSGQLNVLNILTDAHGKHAATFGQ